MTGPYRDRTLPWIGGLFALLLALVAATGWLIREQRIATAQVTHTLEVRRDLAAMLATVQEAETGQRGYLLTRDDRFLESYYEARRSLPTALADLSVRIDDNQQQQARLQRLSATIDRRIERLAGRIANTQRGDIPGASDLLVGKAERDSIRAQLAEMDAVEASLLARRTREARQLIDAVSLAVIAAAVVLLIAAFLVLRKLNGQLRATARARDELSALNRQLLAEAARRETAETQARQLQKMEAVGQLTGGIAHDFNNMLAIVIGSLDLGKRRLAKGDRDKTIDCIDNALEGATRASQLTARLMAFSRQQPLEPQVTDANKLVSGMSELLRRTIGEAVVVETVLAGGLWPTMIDASQLENALVNLCVNGRDAMPDGGKLTIETSNADLDDRYAGENEEVTAGQYVLISVTDTGTGMPPEIIERVFEPFYTTKGVGRGTGLGLSQVFGFIKQSNGHVKIYSEIGQGTTVKLYLPRAARDAVVASNGSGAATIVDMLPHAQGEEIILVVEDDERVRHTSVDALRELGYTVVQASDAKQALAVIEVQPKIDLVFTDVVMPDMNGRQLVEEIGKRWPGLRILYTTGYTRNAIVHNGMLDAGVSLLPKPFTIEQLALKVRQVMDRAG